MNKIEVVIPREEFPLKTVARVSASITRQVGNATQLREAITAAVTEWYRVDLESANAKGYAGSDFNIGDLEGYREDGELPKLLEKHGVKDLDIEIFDVASSNSDWNFDTVLVSYMEDDDE